MTVLSSFNWKVIWRTSIVNNKQNWYSVDLLDDNYLHIAIVWYFRYLHEQILNPWGAMHAIKA